MIWNLSAWYKTRWACAAIAALNIAIVRVSLLYVIIIAVENVQCLLTTEGSSLAHIC